MRGQVWYITVPIGLMCLIRFSLSAFGYANPHWFMDEIGLSLVLGGVSKATIFYVLYLLSQLPTPNS